MSQQLTVGPFIFLPQGVQYILSHLVPATSVTVTPGDASPRPEWRAPAHHLPGCLAALVATSSFSSTGDQGARGAQVSTSPPSTAQGYLLPTYQPPGRVRPPTIHLQPSAPDGRPGRQETPGARTSQVIGPRGRTGGERTSIIGVDVFWGAVAVDKRTERVAWLSSDLLPGRVLPNMGHRTQRQGKRGHLAKTRVRVKGQ